MKPRTVHYMLEGTQPVPCNDTLVWSRWFETAERHVAETHLGADICVTTVFLGMDRQWGDGPPLLFETIVFWQDGPLDGETEQYATWEEAELGHAMMCVRVYANMECGISPPALAGHLCEVCLDAPAIAYRPAPWGGEMGVCAACARQET